MSVRRVAALLCACAAACGLYGEDDPAPAAPSAPAEGGEAGVDALEAGPPRVPSASICSNWSSNSAEMKGAAGTLVSSADWSNGRFDDCDTPHHLYCFEVP